EEVAPGQWELSILGYLGQPDGFPGRLSGLYINAFAQDELGNIYIVARTRANPGPDLTTGLPSGVLIKIVPEPGTALLACAGLVCLSRRPGRRMRALGVA